jgi:hypothetical protein
MHTIHPKARPDNDTTEETHNALYVSLVLCLFPVETPNQTPDTERTATRSERMTSND